MRTMISLLLAIWLVGCAHQEKYMHSQSSVYVSPKTKAAMEVDYGDGLKVVINCLQKESRSPMRPRAEARQCLYASADINTIGLGRQLPRERIEDVAKLLMNVSDANCGNYLYRVFANRSGMDTSRNFLKDLTTGLAAGTVTAAPAVSVGLGFTSLLATSTVDNINATYYFDKSFQAMEAAVLEERAKAKTRILKSIYEDRQGYDLYEVLMDVRALDDSCSIQRGLARLLELASVEKGVAEKKLGTLQFPEANELDRLEKLVSGFAEQLATLEQNDTRRDRDVGVAIRDLETSLRRQLDEFRSKLQPVSVSSMPGTGAASSATLPEVSPEGNGAAEESQPVVPAAAQSSPNR